MLFILLIFCINVGLADHHDKKQMEQHQNQNFGNNKRFIHSNVIYVPYIYYPYSDYGGAPVNNYQTNYYNTSPPTSFSYPQGEWVGSSNGSVPEYAIVYQNTGSQRIFYCRVDLENQTVYGFLVENDGCYINDNNGNKVRYDEYEVLEESNE